MAKLIPNFRYKKQILTHNRRAERQRGIVEGEDEENIKMYSSMVN